MNSYPYMLLVILWICTLSWTLAVIKFLLGDIQKSPWTPSPSLVWLPCHLQQPPGKLLSQIPAWGVSQTPQTRIPVGSFPNGCWKQLTNHRGGLGIPIGVASLLFAAAAAETRGEVGLTLLCSYQVASTAIMKDGGGGRGTRKHKWTLKRS